MNIEFDNKEEQLELLKKIGSRNKAEARAALEAFAGVLGPMIQEALPSVSTAGAIYKDSPFDEDSDPSYPLDLYYNKDAGHFSVWSQSTDAGVPSNRVEVPTNELKFQTYNLFSAINFDKKYARKMRLDVISASIARAIEEVAIKQDLNAWAVIMKALAEANTKNGRSVAAGTANALQHVVRSADTTLQMEDFNSLLQRNKRINVSWAGRSTGGAAARGVTDLYMSVEAMGRIRAFSYTPVRSDSSASTSNSTNLPDSAREGIFNNAGNANIFDKNLHELVELGTGQPFNTLFASFAGSTSYLKYDGTGGSTFTGASDEIIVGIDQRRDAFIRPVSTDSDKGGEVRVEPDDRSHQMEKRSGMIVALDEGRICIDARPATGIMLG